MCWVRPGFLEAKASCFCCVSVLMQVDLPALERPTNAISGTSSAGKKCSCGAVVRNLAVCNQPIATVAADFAGVDFTGEWVADLLGFEGVVIDCCGKPKAPL